jgi:hypothetical protein
MLVVPFDPADLPVVIWTKTNPTPWNTITPEHGTKLVEVNQKFEKRFAFSESWFFMWN